MKPNALQKEYDRLTRAIERVEAWAELRKSAIDADAVAKIQPLRVSRDAIEAAMKVIEDAKR